MRVLLVIHSGAGIGDVVAVTGCAQSLVEDYGAEVWVECRSKAWDYCDSNPFIAGRGWPVPREGFTHIADTNDTNTELRQRLDEPRQVLIEKSRTEFMADFCAHIMGQPVRPTPPTCVVSEERRAWAQAWFAKQGVDPSRAIGFQPVPTKHWRTWPRPLARRLAEIMGENGYAPIVFHHLKHEIKLIPGHPFLARQLWKVFSALSLLPIFVGVDSGLFHLASSLSVPAVGLFGATAGAPLCRSYPLATHVQGGAKGFRLDRRHVCDGPCHKQARLGFYKQTCWYLGCEAMWDIAPEAVWRHLQTRMGRDDA